MILFTSQIISIIYLGEARPYETRYEMRVEMFNEAFIFVLIYHLMLFTKEHIELEDLRHVAGASLMCFTIILLGGNLFLIAIPGIKRTLLKARRRCTKKRELTPEEICEKYAKKALKAKAKPTVPEVKRRFQPTWLQEIEELSEIEEEDAKNEIVEELESGSEQSDLKSEEERKTSKEVRFQRQLESDENKF